MYRFSILFTCAVILLCGATACGGVPNISLNGATETPTRRTARPTFTPKARPTATEEIQPTEEPQPTDEPLPTDIPTQEPVPVTDTPIPAPPQPQRPVQPTDVPPPPPPPPPQFSITIDSDDQLYFCPEENSSVYEIAGSVKADRAWAGGVYFGAFDGAGNILLDGAGKPLIGVSDPESSDSIGSNCRIPVDFTRRTSSNAKLDVGDAVRAGTTDMRFRFINSPTDFTPRSRDFPINFTQGGRWWIYAQVR